MITPAERRHLLALQTCDEKEPILTVEAPMPLPSVANLREHHHAKRRRTMQQRALVGLALRAFARTSSVTHGELQRPLVVRMTRAAPRALDDDNCASALKATRDAIAEWLGVDDRDERIVWLVAQSKAKKAAVVVEVYAMRGET